MSLPVFLAFFIFLLTLVLIIWQPKGLSIGFSACGGALLALIVGVVDVQDVIEVTKIVWNATLALIAIMIISLILDEIGLFEWAALHMARLARGNGMKMFIYINILGAIVTFFFANDGTALILTPIVLAMVRNLNLEEKMILPFIIASGFIADTTSMPLVISNLTNIITADFFNIGFFEYASKMFVPNLFSFMTTVIVLMIYFRKTILKTYDVTQLKEPKHAIKDMKLFRLSWLIITILIIGFFLNEFIRLPVSFIIGSVALFFLAVTSRNETVDTSSVIKSAPWKIVFFSIGLYVVVFGLRNAGLTALLTRLFEASAEQGLFIATFAIGFVAAILSSVMNNLPTVMIDAIAISDSATSGVIREALIYANVIGTDVGPKMTPIGSLSTLLWLHVLAQRGIKISWGNYFKIGLSITIPILCFSLFGLWITLMLFY